MARGKECSTRMIGMRVSQRRFFGMPLASGCTCRLETCKLGPGVALAVSQATLAEPLLSESATVQLFCNGMLLCSLSQDAPNARLPSIPTRTPSFKCVGPKGTIVHVVGYTHAQCQGQPMEEEDVEVVLPTGEEYAERQRARKRRVQELQREAVAASERPSTPPTRTRRLTFNPEVLSATYSRKRSCISPVWVRLSLDVMVARREETMAREALESLSDDDDDSEDDDDGEALQQALHETLFSSSVPKLRMMCASNGLDMQGPKSCLLERLKGHIAMGLLRGPIEICSRGRSEASKERQLGGAEAAGENVDE
mmetsp:Transcript_33953/g.56148  ORF Transcript_33953/g.56148 Transcript_33953/m.56148 type:complete len:311 (+) Transcript_33953:188-1120(+)